MSVHLPSTHKGNVYEILADFLLSLLGIANPQRRQFDDGYDFYCSISNEDNGLLTFDFPFTIQIKSGSSFQIKYGKQLKKWKSQDISWLFNHSTPFFLGFIDVNAKSLSIYDTSGIWYLYGKGNINCSQIIFKSNKREFGVRRELPKITPIKKWENQKGDGSKYEIDLGNPIIDISVKDIENPDTLQKKREILRDIIVIERENIMNRNLGIFCFKEIKQNTTNENMNVEWGIQILSNYEQQYISKIYDSISFALISLSLNLHYHQRDIELNAIKNVLKHIPQKAYYKDLYNQYPELFDWVNDSKSEVAQN